MSHVLWCLLLTSAAAQPLEMSAEATTHLYVRTTPSGAQILLDGKELGTSPGVFPVEPGQRRRLVIELDGQVAKEQQIAIRDGRITRIELTLTPPEPDAASESPRDAKVESRSVGKKVSDFPEAVDLSSPETACAAFHRASAAMDTDAVVDLCWVTIFPDTGMKMTWTRREAGDLADYNKAQLDAEILEVLSYGEELAAVVSHLEFPPGASRHPISLRTFGRIDGEWKNLGEDRCSSLEVATTIFSQSADRHWQKFLNIRDTRAAALVAAPGVVWQPLPDANEPLAFGPVIERVVNDAGIDFDTGKVLSPPVKEDLAGKSLTEWFAEAGVDAAGGPRFSVSGLRGIDMNVMPISNEGWDQISRNDVMVRHQKWARLIHISGEGDLPATFSFNTREGGVGLLQILEFTEEPKGVKIRYKLVQSGGDEAALREVISRFVEAVLQSDQRTAVSLLADKMSFNPDRSVGEAREAIAAGLKMGAIAKVHVGQNQALVVTEFARFRDPMYKEPVCTVYSLSKHGTGWAIADIDVEDEEGLAGEIRRFREMTRQGGADKPREREGDMVILTFEVDPEAAPDDEAVDVEGLLDMIRRRLDRGWVGRVEVRPVGGQSIEVIAFTTDQEQVRRIERLVESPGTIEFRVLANERDHKELIERARKEDDRRVLNPDGTLAAWWVPVALGQEADSKIYPGSAIRTIQEEGSETTEVLVVEDPFDVTDAYLVEATSGVDSLGKPCVGFTFDTRGGQLLGGLTGANLPDKSDGFSRRLGIILNGHLHSAPAIRSTIHDRGEISGDFTGEEVEDLVDVLNAGPLAVPLEQVSEIRVSR